MKFAVDMGYPALTQIDRFLYVCLGRLLSCRPCTCYSANIYRYHQTIWYYCKRLHVFRHVGPMTSDFTRHGRLYPAKAVAAETRSSGPLTIWRHTNQCPLTSKSLRHNLRPPRNSPGDSRVYGHRSFYSLLSVSPHSQRTGPDSGLRSASTARQH